MSTSESRLDEPACQRTDGAASPSHERISSNPLSSIDYPPASAPPRKPASAPQQNRIPAGFLPTGPVSTRGMEAL